MCGEHCVSDCSVDRSAGSSPHVRGARGTGMPNPRVRGIIPACAGSTQPSSDWLEAVWDHPRMCGEHRPRRRAISATRGSSPHVRGALSKARTPRSELGIIPACAGSTLGSQELKNRLGIIPACAGSTPCRAWSRRGVWDHPRMCGEHVIALRGGLRELGSSPHVRGALLHLRVDARNGGIIPACAGSTSMTMLTCEPVWDHPRMCGEHGLPDRLDYPDQGSSPHVRGAPQ